LGAIDSFAAAVEAIGTLGVPIESMTDYGTGFELLKEKTSLVGVPLLIVQWSFYPGEYGDDFVSVECVTKDGRKFIFNDGSTGICKQLKSVAASRRGKSHPEPQAGLMVTGGLVQTSYWFNSDTKETSSKPQTEKGWGPASTFYLAD
jgi:hypothetical protein